MAKSVARRMGRQTIAPSAAFTKSASRQQQPLPIDAAQVAPQSPGSTTYPADFLALIQGRTKRRLGDHVGLYNFGVNMTTLEPGSSSALQHHHTTQDEFVLVLQGTPTLVLGDDKLPMTAGQCVGFPKNQGVGHCIINASNEIVVYLEVGDRSPGDIVEYPRADLMAHMDSQGAYIFMHKDGTPYASDTGR